MSIRRTPLDQLERKGKKTVLIVDNDDDMQKLLRGVLENMAFDTRTTWSGYEALALLESQSVDVLLIDDYIPDLHFEDLLRRVVNLPFRPWIIIMQAAVPNADNLRRYTLLGVSNVVRKHHLAEVCKAVSACCIDDPLAKSRVN
jgi:CheY-like chemotaxis protein